MLLYIGGHVRAEDTGSNADILLTITRTLHREIQEEIGESISVQETNPFIIYSPDSEQSSRHFAVCYLLEMDLEDKKFKLTSDEFIMKTGTSKSGHILNIDEIVKGSNKIEAWSEIILEHVFKRKRPKNLEIFPTKSK